MYKLFHKLFGWDYIHWKNFAAQGIARVRIDGDGNPYYIRYPLINVYDTADGSVSKIRWLTCPRSKYFPNQKD